MREIMTKLYRFDELTDAAKEKARDWYREDVLDYDWYDYIYEDAKTIGLKITGFDLGRAQNVDGELLEMPIKVDEFLKRLFEEHCIMLEKEMEYLLSDESV